MKTEFIYLLFLIFLLPLFTNGQFAVIRGTITSEKHGTSLENVNILETFSEIGTITNTKGEFSLMLHPGNTELIVTLDGFQSVNRKFVLHADTTINITLEPKLNYKNRQKSGTHADLAQKTEKK
jgi:CarboxypepD_reg-like domain